MKPSTSFIYIIFVDLLITIIVSRFAVEMNRSPDRVSVVIGGGLAGLSAAIELANTDAVVIILEKERRYSILSPLSCSAWTRKNLEFLESHIFHLSVGGNSAKASSGINGAGTELQHSLSISDSVDNFINDTLVSGERECQEELVQVLASRSADAIHFLVELGVPLRELVMLGGHSVIQLSSTCARSARDQALFLQLVSVLMAFVELRLLARIVVLSQRKVSGQLRLAGRSSPH